MTDYKIVRILARKFANPELTEEDLFQEGALALMRAEQTFNPDRDVKFETYASRVISRRFIDLIRKQNIHAEELNEDIQSGEFNLDDQVNLIRIKTILNQVPDLERAIFNSYTQGYSYEEIGKIFELPRKKIDNIVQKVKRKIKESI